MRLLLKRVKRGLYTYRRSSLLCALTIFASLCAFVTFMQSGYEIEKSFEMLCDECLTSDYVISGSFDSEFVENLASISDVEYVSPKLSMPTQIICKNETYSALLNIYKEEPSLDKYIIVEGTDAGKDGVLLSYGFAKYNNIEIGDTIEILLANNQFQKMCVNGLYTSASEVSAASVNEMNGLSGRIILFRDICSFNTVSVKIFCNEDKEIIENRLKNICPEDSVVSDTYDTDSFVAINNTAGDYKLIGSFIGIIILLIGVALAVFFVVRLIALQNKSIAILKSIGYPNNKIIGYYVLLITCFSSIATFLGVSLGLILSKIISYRVCEEFLFSTANAVYTPIFIVGIFVEIIILVVTFLVSLRIIKQPVSNIYNMSFVKKSRHLFIERFDFLWKKLSFQTQNSIRMLFRHKTRGIISIVGIALGLTLCITVLAINYLNGDYARKMFNKTYNYSIKATTDSEESFLSLQDEVNNNSLITLNEEAYEFSCTLTAGDKNYSGNCMIMIEDSLSYNIYSQDGELLKIQDDGIVINQSIADYLGLSEGDKVVLENDEHVSKTITISKICSQYIGEGVFISKNVYIDLFDSLPSNAELLICTNDAEKVVTDLERIAGVKCINEIRIFDMMQDNNKSSALTFFAISAIGTLFSIVLFISMTNTSINEREREITIMRTLGISQVSVFFSFFKEWLFLAFVGLVFCFPLSKFLISTLIDLTIKDYTLQVPRFVPINCVCFAIVVLLCSIFISLILLNCRMKRIQLVSLNSNE